MYTDPYGLQTRPWPIPTPISIFFDIMKPTQLGNGTCYQNGVNVCSTVSSSPSTSVVQPKVCTASENGSGCPPCRTVSGKIVVVGTIAYRPLDVPDRPQHGIEGSHYNIYKANQNPTNCQCFWQSVGAVVPADLPYGAIPIEPFAN